MCDLISAMLSNSSRRLISGLRSSGLNSARMFSSNGIVNQQYDLAVVGGGPGGYVAAIKAAQLGMKVSKHYLLHLRP